MLAARLIKMIEDHAEQLTRGVLQDLQSNARTPAYHRLSREELHQRVFDVYSHLGQWLDHKTEDRIAASYGDLGQRRHAEGIPISEVVYALLLLKHHLREYILTSGTADSLVELYQEEGLHLLIDNFFDKAVYFALKGYEEAARPASRAS
jgi:hypothetical protein